MLVVLLAVLYASTPPGMILIPEATPTYTESGARTDLPAASQIDVCPDERNVLYYYDLSTRTMIPAARCADRVRVFTNGFEGVVANPNGGA